MSGRSCESQEKLYKKEKKHPELIPSKTVREYMEEQGRVLTDYEKATLIYNHSGMDYEEKTECLKELSEKTEDTELKEQIQERIAYDERCRKRFYKKEDGEIYKLFVYSSCDDQYLNYGHFLCGALAVRSGKKFQEKFYIQKIKLFTEETERENCQEKAARYFNADGTLRDYYSYEVSWSGQTEETDHERFENAYVEIPFPFQNGDFVRVKNHQELNGQICLVEGNQQTAETSENKEWFCGMDYSDATIRVAYIYENAKFGHAHVNIADVEYAELNKEDSKNILLICAQSLLKGCGGLSDFQYACEEYCRKMSEEKTS